MKQFVLIAICVSWWIFAPNVGAQSITARAAISYQLGGPQPVTGLRVHVLDKSADAILRGVYRELAIHLEDEEMRDRLLTEMTAGSLTPERLAARILELATEEPGAAEPGKLAPLRPKPARTSPEITPVAFYTEICAAKSRLCGRGYDALSKHIVASGTTDLGGNLHIVDVPEGVYFLYGEAETRAGETIIWNTRVEVPSGDVELSQHNAAHIVAP